MTTKGIQAPVFYSKSVYSQLNDHLNKIDYSKIFIVVDNNSHEHCLGVFLGELQTEIATEVIEIEAGEINKNLETCLGVWNVLSELGADRKSLIINLGGGVVTDLGGFVASTFKRGIAFINVPTTLLSMVDASVGGKNGVDLGNIKNQIGVINQPEMVLIHTSFLASLPTNEMRSGLAEILKHGLIRSEDYWQKVTDLENLSLDDLDQIIEDSVIIKTEIVQEDPREMGLRKTLNYGHTLGHAIESYFLTNDDKPTLLHGEAVAVGMILATYLSKELQDFPEDKLDAITTILIDLYGKLDFVEKDINQIIDLMKFDKKNDHGNVNFVLLEDIGKPVINCIVPNNLIFNAFDYYLKA